MRKKMILATVLAILSGVILAYTSVVLFAPVKWNLRFPGGAGGLLSGVALSILMSVAAARGGTRWFYLLVAWAVTIFAYLAFFYRPPMWT